MQKKQHLELNTERPLVGSVLAFDFGEKRIGVAVGNQALSLAHPLVTVSEATTKRQLDIIAKLIDEWKPVQLVVGLPAHADGRAHKLTRLSRQFARRLEGRFCISTKLVDERYTSVVARAALRETGIKLKKQKLVLDQIAAQQILQSYFDRQNVST